MSEELKPCPMCGSLNIKLADLAGWEIWCADCGVMAGTVDGQGDAHTHDSAIAAWNRRIGAAPVVPEGWRLVPDHAGVDEIVTSLYRRFKDWSKRGFSADDVTWCEVKADVLALIATAPTEKK